MLPHPTLDKLQTLRLHGMLKALNEQLKTPDIDSLSFEDNPEDFRKVTDMIDASLYGLFPMEEQKP